MPRSSLLLRSPSGPPPPPNRAHPPPRECPQSARLGPGRMGPPAAGSELLLPLASVLLKLLPVHLRVTTRPEAHSSLKWKKSEFMINTQGL